MDIKSINSRNLNKVSNIEFKSPNNLEDKERIEKGTKQNTAVDQLQISPDARKLQVIRQRIENNFYEQPQVQNKVAQKIYQKYFKP